MNRPHRPAPSTRKWLSGLLVAALFTFAVLPAHAENVPWTETDTWPGSRVNNSFPDVLLFRPWNAAAVPVGFAFFVLSSPVFLIRDWVQNDGKLEESEAAWEGMVGTPLYHAFVRPVGVWEVPPWKR